MSPLLPLLVGTCPHLSPPVRYVFFLPLPVGHVYTPSSACWMPTFICLYLLGACLCLWGAYLLLSSCVGMGLSLCRPTGDAEGSLQAMGTGEERGKERGEGVGLELGNHRP